MFSIVTPTYSICVGFDGYADGGYGGGVGFGGDNPMGMEMGGGGFDGQGEAKSEEKKYKEKNILPVTVKQILDNELNPEGSLMVDGNSIELVKIVGITINSSASATKHEYMISDGTNTIEAFKWSNKEDGANADGAHAPPDMLPVNTMVTVVGNVKLYQDKKSLFLMSIRPVETFNEMTHHLLDVIVHHQRYTKGPIPGSKAATALQQGSGYGMGMGAAGASMFGTPGGGNFGAAVKQEAGGLEQEITAAISQTGQGEVGSCIADVMSYLQLNSKAHISEAHVRDFVTKGMNEGQLYGTTDDDHFKLVSEC